MNENIAKSAIRKAGEILTQMANRIAVSPWKITIRIGTTDDRGNPKTFIVHLDKKGYHKRVNVLAETIMYEDKAELRRQIFSGEINGTEEDQDQCGESASSPQEVSKEPTKAGIDNTAGGHNKAD